MKKSQRTKNVEKRALILHILSCCCWIGMTIFALIAVFSHVGATEKTGMDILSEVAKKKLVSFATTLVVGIVLAIFIKEKIRTAVYMFSLLVITIIYKEAGMYICLSIWGLDEYVLRPLFKRYQNLTIINKEIDKRE